MSTTTDARIDGSAPPGGGTSVEAAGPPIGRAARSVLFLLIGVLALATTVTVGWAVGAPQSPADDSSEAGFARGMQVHHSQAVEMAFVIRDRTTDPLVRTVAYDIITSQQQQIGQMYGWLARWNLPQTSSDAPMAWMDASAGMAGTGGGHSGPSTGTRSAATMPGMATGADLARLRAARGKTAEVLFLRLMIKHHRGGVAMASAVLARTERPEVRRLARTIRTAQRAEIEQMTQLLAERGAAP